LAHLLTWQERQSGRVDPVQPLGKGLWPCPLPLEDAALGGKGENTAGINSKAKRGSDKD